MWNEPQVPAAHGSDDGVSQIALDLFQTAQTLEPGFGLGDVQDVGELGGHDLIFALFDQCAINRLVLVAGAQQDIF